MSLVLVEKQERIAKIILNRPEKRNALSAELVTELKQAFSRCNADETIKVIVLKSADKPFCAGADLGYLTQLRNNSFEENVADSKSLRDLFELIYTSPKITISEVEGPALAGGCGLASITDFCFATNTASFGYTESKIGFVPALVMVYLRNKVGESVMKDWLLTGRIITADEAAKKGLITQVVETDNLAEFIDKWAKELCESVSASSVKLIKEMMTNIPFNRLDALDYAALVNAKARSTQDCKSGIDAFLNKEKKKW